MLLGTSLVVAALAVLSACAAGGQQANDNPSGADARLAHVHGLGVDPADGTLYAASHYGVFRVPEAGEPQRVGERQQDTMGFTVVGPRQFLGSGHPDPDEDLPNHLGLIASTDAGQSWQLLSLAGEADFHALEAEHGRVYGYDSQSRQLMVSADRTSWDRRARLALADFAVDPANGETLLATTQNGLARSVDGGRTFTAIPGAPRLLLVDWPAEDGLFGAGADGSVYTSQDGGTTWSRVGEVPGAPQALTATGQADVYLATETGIHASRDGGRTFVLRQPLG
ncbi:F510_1955 family glycosylhydrolase [Amycolatopsis sp. NPDC006131]|uniref:F510_1955 family glycosylhydrolase n=1 Tax=Amycolatopsis sp. NPDC006131 TaxID=3156731 RepID=UPI0033BA3804